MERLVPKSQNISWIGSSITTRDRSLRNGHDGAIVWLTGLSGSGKSTIARELEQTLFHNSIQTYVLDGDNIRHGLNANLGFSPEDRAENIRRIGEVAKLMADAGFVVVTAFISPYQADRSRARKIAMESSCDFVECFIDAPLEICEQRDPKQLYKKARAGKIAHFTGIDAPYEVPEDPELVIHTDKQTIDESVTQIVDFLMPRIRVGTAGSI